jgi:Protein of unknown function (DUF3592)
MSFHYFRQWVDLALLCKALFGVTVGSGGIWLQRLRQRARQNRAAGWSSTPGTVWSCNVGPKRRRRYLATVTYNYYAGEYRSGTYVHEFKSKAEADEFARSMQGRGLLIRYDPRSPEISVLDESMARQLVPAMR